MEPVEKAETGQSAYPERLSPPKKASIVFFPKGWMPDTGRPSPTFGIFRPTYIVQTSRTELERTGHIKIGKFEDDLGRYKAAFMQVNGIAAVIRRYKHVPTGEYTLFLDTGNVLPCPVDVWKISDALIEPKKPRNLRPSGRSQAATC